MKNPTHLLIKEIAWLMAGVILGVGLHWSFVSLAAVPFLIGGKR